MTNSSNSQNVPEALQKHLFKLREILQNKSKNRASRNQAIEQLKQSINYNTTLSNENKSKGLATVNYYTNKKMGGGIILLWAFPVVIIGIATLIGYLNRKKKKNTTQDE